MSTHSGITGGRRGNVRAEQQTQSDQPSGSLTFAGAGVIQVEPVSLLGALQLALGGEELAGRVVRLVVRPTHL